MCSTVTHVFHYYLCVPLLLMCQSLTVTRVPLLPVFHCYSCVSLSPLLMCSTVTHVSFFHCYICASLMFTQKLHALNIKYIFKNMQACCHKNHLGRKKKSYSFGTEDTAHTHTGKNALPFVTTVAPTLCGKQKASRPFLQVLPLRGWQWTALLFVMTLVSPHPVGRRKPFSPSLCTKYSRLEVVVDGVVSAARLTPGRKALPAPRKSVDGPGSGFTSNSFSITLFLPPAAFFGGFLPGWKTASTFPMLLIRVE